MVSTRVSTWIVAILACLMLGPPALAGQPGSTAKKIVFLAGKKSHGAGVHEYASDVKLLQQCLQTSPNVKGIRAESHSDGWPRDAQTLDDADTIVLLSDGLDKKSPLEQHPFLRGDHLDVIARQVKRRCGLVFIHWPLWVPSQVGQDQFTPWVGGFCDYQNQPGAGMSDAVDWSKQAAHPICRGVRPFNFHDEYYANVRFLGNDPRFTPILPFPGKPKAPVWAWAWERDDGGRSFAYLGGHVHKNWRIPSLRRVVLNAILWTANVEVPAQGVESSLPGESTLPR